MIRYAKKAGQVEVKEFSQPPQDHPADNWVAGFSRGGRLDLDLELWGAETQTSLLGIAYTWHLRFAGPDEATLVPRVWSCLSSTPFPKRLDALWNPL